MMPVMDGYELTKTIREFYDIPIILLTAKDQIEDKEKGFLSGTEDYLVKPFEPKELIPRTQTLLRLYDQKVDEIVTIGHTNTNRKSYEVTNGDTHPLHHIKKLKLYIV